MTSPTQTITAVGISGSPSANSRSRALLVGVLGQLAERGVQGALLDLLDLPAEALLARQRDAAVDAAIAQVTGASIILLGTPVYRATYAGQLKAFLDLFPQEALAGKAVGLIASGAGPGHLLAIDHGLRPLVASLRGLSAANAVYVTDAQLPDKTLIPAAIAQALGALTSELLALAYGLSRDAAHR
jgi:FMN reductase